MKLVIGNKNYSSWSLRAWLFLRESGLDFEEIRIPLYTDQWREEIARYSPAGKVPVLVDGSLHVWDSLAIIQHVQERHPQAAVGWPEAPEARALARSIAAEMHSGFLAVREELPMNIRVRRPRDLAALSGDARVQIARIDAMWSDCRRRFRRAGPWLFGRFSVADVMFAPVALRFVSYEIPLAPEAREFLDAVLGLASVEEWSKDARAEVERLAYDEV